MDGLKLLSSVTCAIAGIETLILSHIHNPQPGEYETLAIYGAGAICFLGSKEIAARDETLNLIMYKVEKFLERYNLFPH